LPNTASADSNNSQLSTIHLPHGQIYRTENKGQPPLRRPTLWIIEIFGAEKLSARDARAEGRTTQTIRLCHCAWRKAEAPLPIWAARATISPNFSQRLAQARRDRRNASAASGDADRQCGFPARARKYPRCRASARFTRPCAGKRAHG